MPLPQRGALVILLTKLDGTIVCLSLESVKYIESVPDTLIFFLNGDSLIVAETLEQIIQRSLDSKAKILRLAQLSNMST